MTTEKLMQEICEEINGDGPEVITVWSGPRFSAPFCCDGERAAALVRSANIILRERMGKYDAATNDAGTERYEMAMD